MNEISKFQAVCRLTGVLAVLFYFLVVSIIVYPVSGNTQDQIQNFLINDTTDQNEYLPYYTCGHYARDTARNASQHNITLGGVILSNHRLFMTFNNHIMNYYLDDVIMLIEPQTDQIMRLNDTMYNYYRLYPDGTQTPSNWCVKLAPTGEIY